jgi:hypothetical protein
MVPAGKGLDEMLDDDPKLEQANAEKITVKS